MKLLAKTSNPVECENIKTILSSQKITYRIDVRNKNNMFKFVTKYYIFVGNKDYQKATEALRQYSKQVNV